MRSNTRDVQLVCLPFAGSGASFFNEWRALSERLEIVAVQLPGRERRFAEKPYDSVSAAVAGLLPELLDQLDRHRPIAIFGHSLGAMLAYELVPKLGAIQDLFVIGLVASGSPDPWSPRAERATGLSDEEFLQQVTRFAGYSHSALENPMMRELLLPTLRADVAMHENYRPASHAPLDIPILAVRGAHDDLVSAEQLSGWSKATSTTLTCVELPGAHMYLTECPQLVLQTIEATFL